MRIVLIMQRGSLPLPTLFPCSDHHHHHRHHVDIKLIAKNSNVESFSERVSFLSERVYFPYHIIRKARKYICILEWFSGGSYIKPPVDWIPFLSLQIDKNTHEKTPGLGFTQRANLANFPSVRIIIGSDGGASTSIWKPTIIITQYNIPWWCYKFEKCLKIEHFQKYFLGFLNQIPAKGKNPDEM